MPSAVLDDDSARATDSGPRAPSSTASSPALLPAFTPHNTRPTRPADSAAAAVDRDDADHDPRDQADSSRTSVDIHDAVDSSPLKPAPPSPNALPPSTAPTSDPVSPQPTSPVTSAATASAAAAAVLDSPTPSPKKRTVSGSIKSPEKPSSDRIQQISENLRARLSLAMLKVQHGWTDQSLEELEQTAAKSPRQRDHPRRMSIPPQTSAETTTPRPASWAGFADHKRTNSAPPAANGNLVSPRAPAASYYHQQQTTGLPPHSQQNPTSVSPSFYAPPTQSSPVYYYQQAHPPPPPFANYNEQQVYYEQQRLYDQQVYEEQLRRYEQQLRLAKYREPDFLHDTDAAHERERQMPYYSSHLKNTSLPPPLPPQQRYYVPPVPPPGYRPASFASPQPQSPEHHRRGSVSRGRKSQSSLSPEIAHSRLSPIQTSTGVPVRPDGLPVLGTFSNKVPPGIARNSTSPSPRKAKPNKTTRARPHSGHSTFPPLTSKQTADAAAAITAAAAAAAEELKKEELSGRRRGSDSSSSSNTDEASRQKSEVDAIESLMFLSSPTARSGRTWKEPREVVTNSRR
ncbi:hypothetical protein BZA70DRAFT_297204 [Myxozyma melibiosi]|uniref:Uncharacterized protein n=1 Tax=Myxozyma melibiosi TaxID=54550 RepID=A0ABR1F0R3_9ASCO